MQLEQRRQAMLQLHLSDRLLYCQPSGSYIRDLTVTHNNGYRPPRPVILTGHWHYMSISKQGVKPVILQVGYDIQKCWFTVTNDLGKVITNKNNIELSTITSQMLNCITNFLYDTVQDHYKNYLPLHTEWKKFIYKIYHQSSNIIHLGPTYVYGLLFGKIPVLNLRPYEHVFTVSEPLLGKQIVMNIATPLIPEMIQAEQLSLKKCVALYCLIKIVPI